MRLSLKGERRTMTALTLPARLSQLDRLSCLRYWDSRYLDHETTFPQHRLDLLSRVSRRREQECAVFDPGIYIGEYKVR